MGFRPLLSESDGKGGYHLRIRFAAPVPGAVLRASRGLQQDEVPADVCGNWLRLIGMNPKRRAWPAVYDGRDWLTVAAAVAHVLTTENGGDWKQAHTAWAAAGYGRRAASRGVIRTVGPM